MMSVMMGLEDQLESLLSLWFFCGCLLQSGQL